MNLFNRTWATLISSLLISTICTTVCLAADSHQSLAPITECGTECDQQFDRAVLLTKTEQTERALAAIKQVQKKFEQPQNGLEMDMLLDTLKQRVSSEPRDADALYKLAWAYLIKGHCVYESYSSDYEVAHKDAIRYYRAAAQSFDGVVNLNPHDAYSQSYLVHVQAMTDGNLEQCEKKLRTILIESPCCGAAQFFSREISLLTTPLRSRIDLKASNLISL